jgi:pSer/pThr/pTyr-binding forkhead associated (FHA) protein
VGLGLKHPWAPHTSSPVEIKERLEAERSGAPHVVYRDSSGRQVLTWLDREVVTLGRSARVGISLSWDSGVSRVHAELQRIGDVWTLVDDGLSRNGSFINGRRVAGRQRLEDGDVITAGSTTIAFRAPGPRFDRTEPAGPATAAESVSAAERCVLVALCRPLQDDAQALPATNRAIAEELCLSVPAVKRRLSVLFERFGLDGLPQNQKRVRLADEAVHAGLVSPLHS